MFSELDSRKIDRSVGLTARKWHGVSPTCQIFFPKSGFEKNRFKTITFLSHMRLLTALLHQR